MAKLFVSSDRRVLLHTVFSLSTWSAANFSWALRCCIRSKGFFFSRQPLSPWWCKTLWLWTQTPVLQQLLNLVDSWPSWSLVSQQQVTVCVYIGYHLKNKKQKKQQKLWTLSPCDFVSCNIFHPRYFCFFSSLTFKNCTLNLLKWEKKKMAQKLLLISIFPSN